MSSGKDFDQFEVGATLQPLSTSSSNGALQDADPAVFYLIDFLTWAINTYPGPRIVQAAAAAQVLSSGGVAVATACMDSYWYEPEPQFLENQFAFPSLFLWRTQGQSEQWTASFEHDVCGVTLVYALPPLDASQSEQMLPFLKAVHDVVRKKASDGWDPNYTPPGGSLGQPWMELANVEEVGFAQPRDKRVVGVSTGFEYGSMQGTGKLVFPCVIMRGYMIERDMYAPTQGGVSKFAGADITTNVDANDGTRVLATSSTVAQASTQQAPTLASLSVATGSSAGGTSTVLTGTLFLSGPPAVFFGPASNPQYATSVTYGSSTSLTVTTPPMQGAGTVDVTVVNRDGQACTLPAAFTYT